MVLENRDNCALCPSIKTSEHCHCFLVMLRCPCDDVKFLEVLIRRSVENDPASTVVVNAAGYVHVVRSSFCMYLAKLFSSPVFVPWIRVLVFQAF